MNTTPCSSAWEKDSRRPRRFAEIKLEDIDYKNERMLRRFTTERGKIIPRRISGNCAKHQRMVKMAIKRARYLALLPYVG